MATTINDIREWFEDGDNGENTHMIVVVDTFDYTDFPIYVGKSEDVRATYHHLNGEKMQKVMEVYSYKDSFEEQAGGRVDRFFNFD